MQSLSDHAHPLDEYALRRAHGLITGPPPRPLPPEAVEALAHEVVQRLAERRTAVAESAALPPESDVDALCTALLSAEADASVVFVLNKLREGVPPDTIYLGYIAGAARRLGALWEDDLVTFYDVTLAAGRIFGLLRSMRFLLVQPDTEAGRQAIFATVPGEDHAIGVTIAADIFRREGWDVALHVGLTHEALLQAVRSSGIRIVAVSAGSQRSLLPLARLVVALHVLHPPAQVMVSGHLTIDEPEFIAHLGADAVARDMPEALAEMERLRGLSVRRQGSGPSPAVIRRETPQAPS